MSETILKVQHLGKSFGNNEILKDIDFSVKPKDVTCIIGPSGSGKSTLLRCMNLLETPSSGEIRYHGTNIMDKHVNVPEYRSKVGMVFQNFNLFNNMTVLKNCTVGQEKVLKKSKEEAHKNAMMYLEKVGMAPYINAKPKQLSGGQKQRVAIARALANNPRVLLLDEPLGALDLQLRRTMQLELKRLQKKLGITFIYITHDQEEAINMSDRIVVMNQGQFEQIGTPDEIYNHPKTSYVAAFVGNANILKGIVAEKNGHHIKVKLGDEVASIDTEEKVNVGENVTVALRGEHILLEENGDLHATVKEKNFAAGQLRVLLTLPNGDEVTASRFGMNADIQPGQQICWRFEPKDAVLVDRPKGGTN